ncbi:MAG TPA: sigma-70 family RNA polymerase sigma factor [Planctomycetota bacterium]|nr:sigma-70 family RNA polymerase sigma factor [Planctomycetota bacterium]
MDDSTTSELLERARSGDRSAIGSLFESQRARLRRMLALRIDGRLRGRVEPADVIQDAFLEATLRFDEYLRAPSMPFYLWLRFITTQRLHAIYREHLGTQKRDARREVGLYNQAFPQASSEALAAQLLGKVSTPSETAIRSELRARLLDTLEAMDPGDRELIALRHFEQLGNGETAQILGIDESAASKRYVRAMTRLRTLLDRIPGMAEYPWK